jgi:hypothetical protein
MMIDVSIFHEAFIMKTSDETRKVKISSFFIRVLAVLTLIGLILAAYFMWARPYQLHWGATQAEIIQPMPGDELAVHPTFLATRAITIAGTPQEIWPWLMQMGYERAGFYGYDILENVGSKRGIQSAEQILPEFQGFKVGDDVPISAVARMVFHAIEPDQYLIWSGSTGVGGFTWALYPLDEGHTRLISRIRWSHHWAPPDVLALDLFTEFTDHLAVRKILQGVRDRVEGDIEPMAQANTEFAIYVTTVLIFFVAIIVLLVRPLSWTMWLVGLGAGIVWLITWYAPIPIWIAVLSLLCVLYGLWQATTRRSMKRQQ